MTYAENGLRVFGLSPRNRLMGITFNVHLEWKLSLGYHYSAHW